VLRALADQDRPLTAIEVHQAVGQHVGLATVYCTLRALADAGLVHVFAREGETAWRRCDSTPHYHPLCDACGEVFEQPPQDLAGLPHAPISSPTRNAATYTADAAVAYAIGRCQLTNRGTTCSPGASWWPTLARISPMWRPPRPPQLGLFQNPSCRTGLGLAIVRTVISAWRAIVCFHAQPGHGTTVVLRLPHIEAHDSPFVNVGLET